MVPWCLAVFGHVLLLGSGLLAGVWWLSPLWGWVVRSARGWCVAAADVLSSAGEGGAVCGGPVSCGLPVCVRGGRPWLPVGCYLVGLPCFGLLWLPGCWAAGGDVALCAGMLVVVWLHVLVWCLLVVLRGSVWGHSSSFPHGGPVVVLVGVVLPRLCLGFGVGLGGLSSPLVDLSVCFAAPGWGLVLALPGSLARCRPWRGVWQ